MRFVIQRVTRGKVSVDASNPDVSNELYYYSIIIPVQVLFPLKSILPYFPSFTFISFITKSGTFPFLNL